MTKWKTISVFLFLLSIFIFVVFSLVQLTPMYGPPDEMARDTTRRLKETALVHVCHRHSHCGEYCELSCRMETVTGPSQKRMIRWIPDVYRDGR